MKPSRQYLTRQQVAERLALSTRQVDRLLNAGALVRRHISSRAVRVPVESLERFMSH